MKTKYMTMINLSKRETDYLFAVLEGQVNEAGKLPEEAESILAKIIKVIRSYEKATTQK